jgi:hypothetical protein
MLVELSVHSVADVQTRIIGRKVPLAHRIAFHRISFRHAAARAFHCISL